MELHHQAEAAVKIAAVIVRRRLTAMLHGLDQVQPALAKFYASLSDEQKARFNRFSARSG